MNVSVCTSWTNGGALGGARSAFLPFAFFSCVAAASATQESAAQEAATNDAAGASAAPTPSVESVELEATLDVPLGVAVEPFDGVAWERRLALVDLDRRERAVARLEAILPHSPDAQAWVRAQAQHNEGEVAWTCRMLVRAGARDAFAPGQGGERAELFVWRGNDDRVLLGGPERALRVEGGALDVFVVESVTGESRRSEADVRRARRAASLADIVPLPPGAAPTELRFDVAITGRTDDTTPLGTWRVLQGADGELQLFERAGPDELERFVTIERANSIGRGGSAGLFVLERRAPNTGQGSAVLESRPFTASMDRLGVYVDVESDGLVVLDIEPGSVAHVLGVARGDRLAAIDGVELARPEDITARLRAAAATGSVSVRWQRGGDGLVIERRYVVPREPLAPVEPAAPAAPSSTPAPAPLPPVTKD